MPYTFDPLHDPDRPDDPRDQEPGESGPDAQLPLSVWACAQQPAASQRRGRYLPSSTAHPAKMLPAVGAAAITAYTQPGDIVLDPMCGIGTTLVEAAHLDRTGIGIECEPRWADLARANLDHARDHGATGHGAVITGDARNAAALVTDPHLADTAALLLTSPPYGQTTHGQVRSSRDTRQRGIRKWDHRYGTSPHNLARANHTRLLAGFTDILTGCLPLLRPGGIVAITTRPFRRHGHLIDFPGQAWAAAQDAGLQPLQRLIVLLCGIKNDRLVPRASFFAMHETRRARQAGIPLHITAHEDLLILRKPLQRTTQATAEQTPAGQEDW